METNDKEKRKNSYAYENKEVYENENTSENEGVYDDENISENEKASENIGRDMHENKIGFRKKKSGKYKRNNMVNTKFTIILSLIVLILIISLVAPYIAPNDPYKTNLLNTLKPPSREYLFGTDALGRCVFSRVLYGASKSVFSALVLVAAVFSFGTVIGVISGFAGDRIDGFIMSIVDIFLAFPGLILAIAVAGILGGGMKNAMIAIGLISWTKYARLARSEVLAINNETFIQAAILSGNSRIHIISKHIIPNILGSLVITASLDIGVMIMEIAGLSFLGLSSPLPIPEWGSMMNEGRSMLQFAPWITLFPGAAILIVVVLFNLLGDTIHELLNPRRTR